jgi:alginate O-acetyltransferase complex protein AlgI
MVFSGIIFLTFFFPIFLLTYHFAAEKYKNWTVLFASLIFYAWGAPKFIYILLPITAIDFYVVKRMYGLSAGLNKKLWLTASILINLGILIYFKYSNFFIDNVNNALECFGMTQVEWTSVVLPIGISFFCFETLTYSIDAYRNVIKPLDKLKDYYLYIFLFPKLIAGPIVRFNHIENQIQSSGRTTHNDDIILGFWRFCIGLAKKILIANTLAEFCDSHLNGDLINLTSTTAWLSMTAYTFQIYFDFSGYSDMALGIGRMIGFRLPENFDNPYTSRSISEFWRRWHMTLGGWMKEYLYIPLGGNKVRTKSRLYFNLWLVFLVSGLWHGASWNFVIWGAFHGLFLILDKLFLLKVLQKIGSLPSTIITFLVVLTGWVFFRMEKFQDAIIIIQKLFTFNFDQIRLYENREFFTILSLALIFSFFTSIPAGKSIQNKVYYHTYTPIISVGIVLLSCLSFMICLARITSSGFNPFIYFRF